MSCGGGGSTGSSNTVTNVSQPPQQILDAYNSLIGRGTSTANAPLTQYGGAMVAGFNPTQTSAMNTVNNAQGLAMPYINAASQLTSAGAAPITPQAFSGDAVQQYMSPYTKNVVDATQAQFNNQNAQQQQALTSNAISKGAWGGDRAGVAQGILSGQQDLAQAPIIAGLENQGYGQALSEFNTQQAQDVAAQQASGWLAQNAGLGLANLGNEAQATTLGGASAQLQSGALQQQLQQEGINVPYEQFLQQQAYPFQTTGWLSSLVEGLGGASGGTGSTTSPGPSILGQLGGLGLTGLGVYGAGSNLGLWGGNAATAAAGSGALQGYGSAALDFSEAGIARGGRIGKDAGGPISLPDVPQIGSPIGAPMSFMPHHNMGVPSAPAAYTEPDPMKSGMNSMDLASTIAKLVKSGRFNGGRIRAADGGGFDAEGTLEHMPTTVGDGTMPYAPDERGSGVHSPIDPSYGQNYGGGGCGGGGGVPAGYHAGAQGATFGVNYPTYQADDGSGALWGTAGGGWSSTDPTKGAATPYHGPMQGGSMPPGMDGSPGSRPMVNYGPPPGGSPLGGRAPQGAPMSAPPPAAPPPQTFAPPVTQSSPIDAPTNGPSPYIVGYTKGPHGISVPVLGRPSVSGGVGGGGGSGGTGGGGTVFGNPNNPGAPIVTPNPVTSPVAGTGGGGSSGPNTNPPAPPVGDPSGNTPGNGGTTHDDGGSSDSGANADGTNVGSAVDTNWQDFAGHVLSGLGMMGPVGLAAGMLGAQNGKPGNIYTVAKQAYDYLTGKTGNSSSPASSTGWTEAPAYGSDQTNVGGLPGPNTNGMLAPDAGPVPTVDPNLNNFTPQDLFDENTSLDAATANASTLDAANAAEAAAAADGFAGSEGDLGGYSDDTSDPGIRRGGRIRAADGGGMTEPPQNMAGGDQSDQSQYQNYVQLPAEKLRELAVRYPVGSGQGNLIRKAIMAQQAHPQSQQGMAMGAFSPPPMGTPDPSLAGLRTGGRARMADGGDPDSDAMTPPDSAGFIGANPGRTANEDAIKGYFTGLVHGFQAANAAPRARKAEVKQELEAYRTDKAAAGKPSPAFSDPEKFPAGAAPPIAGMEPIPNYDPDKPAERVNLPQDTSAPAPARVPLRDAFDSPPAVGKRSDLFHINTPEQAAQNFKVLKSWLFSGSGDSQGPKSPSSTVSDRSADAVPPAMFTLPKGFREIIAKTQGAPILPPQKAVSPWQPTAPNLPNDVGSDPMSTPLPDEAPIHSPVGEGARPDVYVPPGSGPTPMREDATGPWTPPAEMAPPPAAITNPPDGSTVVAAPGASPITLPPPPRSRPVTSSAPRETEAETKIAAEKKKSDTEGAPIQQYTPTMPAAAKPAAPEPTTVGKLASSPWLAAISAGLGMMASRNPHALGAIGEGGQQGVKTLESQHQAEFEREKQAQETAYKTGDLDQRAKQLSELADYHRNEIARATAADRARATRETDQSAIERERNEIDRERVNKGYFEPISQAFEPDGVTPRKDENGNLLGNYYDRQNNKWSVGPLPDPAIAGATKPSAGAQTFAAKQRWAAVVYPGDLEKQTAFLAGKIAPTYQQQVAGAQKIIESEVAAGITPPAKAAERIQELLRDQGATAPASPGSASSANKAPVGTQENPFVPKTQADIDGAKSGTVIRTPDGKLVVKP